MQANPHQTSSTTELKAILFRIFAEDGHSLKIATHLALEKVTGLQGLVSVGKLNPIQLIVAQKGPSLFMSIHNGEIVAIS